MEEEQNLRSQPKDMAGGSKWQILVYFHIGYVSDYLAVQTVTCS